MTSPYYIHELSNGILLVHRQTKSPVAHLGVIINAGSRDERPEEQGLAHFIEHMVFKGTRKRNANQVINRLENVGADMNAFTTKEETCIYASFLTTHYRRAFELLADIVFDSVFPEEEIQKEKAVIIDELNSYKDNPAEWIHDEFDELVYPGHPLGKNILGTPAHLKKFKQEDLLEFTRRLYLPSRIVLTSVGKAPFSRIIEMAARYFEGWSRVSEANPREIPSAYHPSTVTRKFGRHQSHMILGNVAFNYHDERRVPMALLNNMLGGPAMNSRLNLALRERNGIAYNIESNYQPLSDTGLFSIYVGTEERMLEKAIELVHAELDKLRSGVLSKQQLKISKEQLKGQLAISVESMQNEMISIGKSLMVYGKIDTLQEINAKIDKVSGEMLREIADEVFDPSRMSLLVFRNP